MPLLRLAVSLLALALVVLPTSAYGQAQKVPRIGVLSTLPAQYAAPYVSSLTRISGHGPQPRRPDATPRRG